MCRHVSRHAFRHALGMCHAPSESSRRGGRYEYRHFRTRAVRTPSAMPIWSLSSGASIVRSAAEVRLRAGAGLPSQTGAPGAIATGTAMPAWRPITTYTEWSARAPRRYRHLGGRVANQAIAPLGRGREGAAPPRTSSGSVATTRTQRGCSTGAPQSPINPAAALKQLWHGRAITAWVP